MLVNLIKNTTGDEDDWQDEEGLRKTADLLAARN